MKLCPLNVKPSAKRKKVNDPVKTAEQLAQIFGFSGRTFRRIFSAGIIPTVVKAGAGKGGMPARVATWRDVSSWARTRGIELARRPLE